MICCSEEVSQMFSPIRMPIPNPSERILPSLTKAPKLELKPLPDNLKYMFLGEANTLPVIISNDLSDEQEELLIRVLKGHAGAIG